MPQQQQGEADHVAAARFFADRNGLDLDTFMARYLRNVELQTDRYPDCLKTSEIQLLLHERILAPERVLHIERCPDCAAMAMSVMPRDMDLTGFLAEVRRKGEEELARGRAEHAGGENADTGDHDRSPWQPIKTAAVRALEMLSQWRRRR